MEEEKNKVVLFIRVAVCVALLLVGKIWLTEGAFPWYINLVVNLVAYFVISYDILIDCVEGFKEKNPINECLLMTVTSIGAFLLRLFGENYNQYFEGVMVMLLYQVGEFFQDLADEKTRDAITDAIDLRKEIVKVILDEKIINKSPTEVEVGDVCLFGAGNKVLCDGNIIEGKVVVDESSLTGESLPIEKHEGEFLYSGSLIIAGSCKVKTATTYENSTVGKLISLIKESAEKKSKISRFVDRFAKIYTPIVMCLALVVGGVLPLFVGINDSEVWRKFIYVGLNVLVISCPCSIVLSIPLTCFASIGVCSKMGIMVKGSEYLDLINQAKIFCFDKTGTITSNELSIKSVNVVNISDDEFLEYAVAAESRSSHPIAKAICKGADLSKVDNFISKYNEISGSGITLEYKGHKIKFGKMSFIESCPSIVSSYLISVLEVDGIYSGYIEIGETIKEKSLSTISYLNNKGFKTVILSGDRNENVERIANEVEVRDFKGELLPKDKALYVEDSVKQNKTVFVGDGINDAPSIVRADVGIAMGSKGSDLAIENADIILMKDDLNQIVTLKRVAKESQIRNYFNLGISLVVKLVIILLAVLIESFPLWISVLSDTGLTLLLAAFALTFLLKKK